MTITSCFEHARTASNSINIKPVYIWVISTVSGEKIRIRKHKSIHLYSLCHDADNEILGEVSHWCSYNSIHQLYVRLKKEFVSTS